MTTVPALKAVYEHQNFLVLDTETTGLHRGEVCQIAVIDPQGEVLLDSLVKPVKPIPMDAQRIHHISDAMVADAPNWLEIEPQLMELIRGKDLLVYNAIYDRKMMHQSREAHGLPKIEWKKLAAWHCVMKAYAEFYGDVHPYYGSYRWQKLTTAATQLQLEVKDAHNALGDCQMTLAVLNAMFNR